MVNGGTIKINARMATASTSLIVPLGAAAAETVKV